MKKILCLLMGVVLVLTSGCSIAEGLSSALSADNEAEKPSNSMISDNESFEKETEAPEDEVVFGFSDSEEAETELTKSELLSWENPYGVYSSYILFDSLNDNEKLVYHALEYAMVNSFENTFVDGDLGVDRDRILDIVELLSLDTPFLEQNFLCTVYSETTTYSDNSESTIHRVNVSNFLDELWEYKLLALKEAESVIETFDMNQSEIDLAEDIYRYIAENVTYELYETQENEPLLEPFLYDGLVMKKTHCDGFTNSLALLYALAGFEQVEKHNSETLEHTWNCVKIEGKWYNMEGTAADWIPQKDSSMKAGLLFAFSDEFLDAPEDFDELYPDCIESYYMNPDGYTESVYSEDFLSIVDEGFMNHDDQWALVVVDSVSDSDIEYALDELVEYYSETMYVSHKEILGGKTTLVFAKDNIM